jgi:hypothetical protein
MTKKAITGYPFAGILIDDARAALQVSLNQLEAVGLKSPHTMAKTPLSKTERSDLHAKELREVVQRAWDKARSLRADLYCEYLLNIQLGKIKGSAPPPAIYTPDIAKENGDTIELPFRSRLIAIDGETQLEARYRLREQLPETGETFFPAILHFGIDENHAIQILHDYNRYAKPIPESKLGARNSSGGLSATIIAALGLVGLDDESLNKAGTGGTAKQVAGFAQAMHFVAAYSLGAKGLIANAAHYFDVLNRPGHPPINDGCTAALAAMFDLSAVKLKGDLCLTFRKGAMAFWQAAGVLAAEGADVTTLNWQGAFDADKAAAPSGRGGARLSRADRQRLIYNALKDGVRQAA